MLFSNQYSRGFFWPRLSVEPRQDLIAVTLRGFSQFATGVRQLSVLSVPLSARTLRSPRSSRYCTTIILPSPRAVFSCAFTSMMKCRVPAAKDTTKREPQVLDATGCRWMKYSGRTSSSVSVAHVPMCVNRGTGSRPERELRDGNKWRQPFV